MTSRALGHPESAHDARRNGGWRRLVSFAGLVLLCASVVRELRLPAEQRTWHGRVFGSVPYDLRFPYPGRVAATMWNPDERRLLVPTAFGVGWTVNFAALRPRPR